MENLKFVFAGGARNLADALAGQTCLVGVAGSGNLEVLLQAMPLHGQCEVQVATAARGFAAIWQAVLDDFHQRWQLQDVRVAINDVGATPAVVSLRLDQAVNLALSLALNRVQEGA